MLQAAGVPFETADSEFDEEPLKARLGAQGLGAEALAEALAEAKALAVQTRCGDLVLGSDQTLERHDSSMLDKPASREEAAAQLQALSGRTHRLHSAAVIVEDRRPVWRHVETVSLTMRPLGSRFLSDYLDQEYEAIRWSVGGYRIEGPGVQLFESIEGSHFAILGLPLLPLLGYLRKRGVIPD